MASNNGNSINHFSGTINTPIIVDDCIDRSLKYAGLPYGIEWLRSTPVALLLEPEVLPQVAGNRSKPLAHTVSEPDSVGNPCCYVVIDSENHTRLVATGLTRTEQKEDYLWILEKLREASSGFTPSVMLVDRDPGMDAVLREGYPATQIINCIWHLKENLKRRLSNMLGSQYQHLLNVFDEACEPLTPNAFEDIWNKLLE
ncbi:hypothetical protein FBU30_002205, partial [Linnemannia zychae]